METNIIEYNDYYMRGRALLSAKKYEEAEKYFRIAIEKNSMGIEAYIALVHMNVSLKKFDQAKDYIKKILVIDDKNGEAYFHLGNIAYFEKNAISARANYSKALTYGYNNPVAQYYMAMSNLETGDVVNAKFYLNSILQNNPDYTKARIKLIEIAEFEKHYDEMLAQAEELILIRPDAFEGYHYKFTALMSKNDISSAGKTIMHAINLFPGDYGFAVDLILYYIKDEKYEEALNYIEERFGADDKAKNLIMPQKAKILFKVMRFEEAESVINSISNEYYDDEIYYILIVITLNCKKYDSTLKYCEEALKKYSDSKYLCAFLCYKSICLEKMNKDEEMKVALKEANDRIVNACVNDPGNIELYIYRVLSEMQMQNYDSALEVADFAIQISEGKVAEIYLVRGLVYNKIGENDKANLDFEKAKNMNGMLSDIVQEVLC